MNKTIVICANGLQTAYLGAYGNPWIHTPNIDRLAATGVVFDWHYPDNLTTIPTRRSWWSGHFTLNDPLRGWGPLSSSKELELIERLKAAKIRATLISDCPYVNDPSLGYARAWPERILVRGSGYDAWCDPEEYQVDCSVEPGLRLPDPDSPDCETWKERWNDLLRNRLRSGRLEDESKTGAAQVIDKTIEWLQTHSEKEFLLWLDIFCPHGPWDLPENYRDYYAADHANQFEIQESGDLALSEAHEAKEVITLIDVPGGWVGEVISDDELARLRKTYAGAVTLLDAWVGRLLEFLKSSCLDEQTTIIFTSDQGEPLGEHGLVRRPVATVHEELAHTPLIIRWPGLERAGQRCQAIVQSVDLSSTVLLSLGIEVPNHWLGMNLKEIYEEKQSPQRTVAVIGMDNDVYALRTPEWLLIDTITDEDEAGEENENAIAPQLYVKPEDRWERYDVAALNEETVEQLLQQLADTLGTPDDSQPPK